MSSETIAGAIERVLSAYAELTELGEGIEDEWSYVNDLASAWRDRTSDEAALSAFAEFRPAYTTAFRDAASRNHVALSFGVRFCVLKSTWTSPNRRL